MSNPEASAKSALGLDGNITALLCYLIGIIGLILAFIEKDNKFVRFHAWQSLLLSVGATVLFVALMIVWTVVALIAGSVAAELAGIVSLLFGLLFLVIGLGVFVAAIWAAIQGFQGNIFKIPVVGNFAEKMANK
jgi:uncharacterized membrane protein